MANLDINFATQEHVEDISGKRREPAWLFKDRLTALRNYKRLGAEEHVLFKKYTSLSMELVSETEPYVSPPNPPHLTKCDDNAVTGIFHQDENSIQVLGLQPEYGSKGVVIETLQDLAANHPYMLKNAIMEHSTLPEKDKIAQLTRALWTSGIYIYVPDDLVPTRPIMLRWTLGRGKTASLTRTVLILGSNSQATVVEEIEPSESVKGTGQSMFTGTTEVILGKGAELRFNSIVNTGSNTATFLNRHADIAEDSKVRWALGYVGGSRIKSRIDNLLAGRDGMVDEVEVLYGRGSQMFDLMSLTRHIAEDTKSEMLTKGVIQDQSKAYTKGLVTIEKNGKGSDTYLGEFGMSLSRDTRFFAIPSLEIENHEVRRAKHSSSVTQINEMQVYYLMTRGIEEKDARKLIVLGFLEPVVERIPLESVADKLRGLYERKWAG